MLSQSPNFIGVPKGEDKLRERINEIVVEARKSGESDRMSTRWLGRRGRRHPDVTTQPICSRMSRTRSSEGSMSSVSIAP